MKIILFSLHNAFVIGLLSFIYLFSFVNFLIWLFWLDLKRADSEGRTVLHRTCDEHRTVLHRTCDEDRTVLHRACDGGKKQEVLKLISRLKENKRLKLSCGGPEQCQKIYLLDPETRKVTLAYKAPDLSPDKMNVGKKQKVLKLLSRLKKNKRLETH